MSVNMNTSLVTNATTIGGTASDRDSPKYKQMKIISSLVVVGVFLLVCGFSYLLYRKICRNRRSRHGVEVEEMKASGNGRCKQKKEYFDQFGVDTHELTVNSMTAILRDEDERKLIKMAAAGGGSRMSSGIECDASTSDSSRDAAPTVQTINSGKRVFQVNKVSEKGSKSELGGQHMVIRLHKGLAHATHSLQASDGRNYTLALIDKSSNTIHNIDLRNYRPRTRGKSPLAAEGKTSPRRVCNGKKPRKFSCGDTSGWVSANFDDRMLHDSPDMGRKPQLSRSLEALAREDSSLTDQSNTSDAKDARRSPSLSSKEGDDFEDATHALLPKILVTDESEEQASEPVDVNPLQALY